MASPSSDRTAGASGVVSAQPCTTSPIGRRSSSTLRSAGQYALGPTVIVTPSQRASLAALWLVAGQQRRQLRAHDLHLASDHVFWHPRDRCPEEDGLHRCVNDEFLDPCRQVLGRAVQEPSEWTTERFAGQE